MTRAIGASLPPARSSSGEVATSTESTAPRVNVGTPLTDAELFERAKNRWGEPSRRAPTPAEIAAAAEVQRTRDTWTREAAYRRETSDSPASLGFVDRLRRWFSGA